MLQKDNTDGGGVRAEEYVGQRIRERREELGMSQTDLGQRLAEYLGRQWTRQAVSAAEQGKRAFTAAELVAIAHVLDTRPARLVTPPIELKEVELPGGPVRVRAMVDDVGVADKTLGDMYDQLLVLRRQIIQIRDSVNAELVTVDVLSDQVTTIIGVTETATMHSDRRTGK